MALVEESSSEQRRGRNIGIVVSAATIIGFAITPVLTTQIAAHFGWRWGFCITGAPGFLGKVVSSQLRVAGKRISEFIPGLVLGLLIRASLWCRDLQPRVLASLRK